MIISRSPLRISLGGGGTDLPSYYKKNEGFLLSAAIDKYVYVTIMRPFSKGIYLKYSDIEKANKINLVKHPIIRETLKLILPNANQIEITSLADIPAGTGLGSSGSFTTALIKALYNYKYSQISPENLAELACHIEIDLLNEPIGKQDQYIAATGGINSFTFHKNDKVTIKPLNLVPKTLHLLEDNLVLFFTGFSRKASGILNDQNKKSIRNDDKMLDNLNFVKSIGKKSELALLSGNLDKFGELMNDHWEYKKTRSNGMTNSKIDDWYKLGIKNGAVGGKLVGAGGGGFLMFYCSDKEKVTYAMEKIGLEQLRFRFDFQGTSTILSS